MNAGTGSCSSTRRGTDGSDRCWTASTTRTATSTTATDERDPPGRGAASGARLDQRARTRRSSTPRRPGGALPTPASMSRLRAGTSASTQPSAMISPPIHKNITIVPTCTPIVTRPGRGRRHERQIDVAPRSGVDRRRADPLGGVRERRDRRREFTDAAHPVHPRLDRRLLRGSVDLAAEIRDGVARALAPTRPARESTVFLVV